MRYATLTIATVVALTVNTNLRGEDDFSALLSDLSFGNVTSLEMPPLAVTKEKLSQELKPVPAPTRTASKKVVQELVAPKVALQDPIPAKVPVAAKKADQIDLEKMFAASEKTPAETVGHLLHGHHGGCDANCGTQTIECSPHVKPYLPSSTMYQYFRTNKCNTHVWDGYQQRCRKANAHLSGKCDCFESSHHGGCSSCGVSNSAGCASCSSCDG